MEQEQNEIYARIVEENTIIDYEAMEEELDALFLLETF